MLISDLTCDLNPTGAMNSYFDSAIEYNRTNPISLARSSEQAQTVQNEKNWEWTYLVVS